MVSERKINADCPKASFNRARSERLGRDSGMVVFDSMITVSDLFFPYHFTFILRSTILNPILTS